VQIALVFERPALDERERFQEFGSELLVAVWAWVSLGHCWMPFAEKNILKNIATDMVAAGREADCGSRDGALSRNRDWWLTDMATMGNLEHGPGLASAGRLLAKTLDPATVLLMAA